MRRGNGMNKKIEKKIEEHLEDVDMEKEKLDSLKILQSYEGADELITSEEALKILKEKGEEKTPQFWTKLPTLDGWLTGLKEGDVVVVSGPPKSGKTTLCQTFTINFAEQEVPTLWFSYELTQREFLERFPQPIPYFILPKKLAGNTAEWFEKKIIEGIAKYGTKIVFIDHLHFILDMSILGMRGNVSLTIGAIMRELKKIAIEWNVIIFLVAHTTKIAFEGQPELSDIRDSSFCSQESDHVLMIWRTKNKETKQFENEGKLALLANRRTGKVGIIKLFLQEGQFYEKTGGE